MRTILIWSKLFIICAIFILGAYHIWDSLSSFIFTYFSCINSIMGMPVIRVGDFHLGHFCLGTGVGFHATPFITGSTSVQTNGRFTCTLGSTTVCGDMALGGNPSVLVGGKPIMLSGMPTKGHGCTEAITTEVEIPGPTADGSPLTKSVTDFTCKISGGYYHPNFTALGSTNVFA